MFLKTKQSAVPVLLIMAVLAGTIPQLAAANVPAPSVVTLLQATNEARALHDVPALEASTILQQAAQRKAEQMAGSGDFSHTLSSGESPWSFVRSAGYCYWHAGENLAVHYLDSASTVAAWLQSPTHRENLLATKYQDVGFGIAYGEWHGFDGYLVVQFFGTELAPEYRAFFSSCS